MKSAFARLLLAAILALFSITANGCSAVRSDEEVALDSNDSAEASPSQQAPNGEIHVFTKGGELDPAYYEYKRGSVEQAAWTSSATGGSKSFDRLETYQYTVKADEPVLQLKVDSGSTFCMLAYNGAKFDVVAADGTVPANTFKSGDPLPVQITFMRSARNPAGDCNLGSIDTTSAVALWLSTDNYWPQQPANATICNLEAETWAAEIRKPYENAASAGQYKPIDNKKFKGSSADCVIDQIGYHQYGADNVYGATLFTMLTDKAANDAKKPLFINLGDHQVFLAKLGQVLSSSYRDVHGNYTMINTQRPIIVTGTSVIDGSGAPSQRGGCTDDCPLSDLLVLSSDFPVSDQTFKYAIDVTGVSVADAPSLGHSAIRLNDMTLSGAGTQPVKAFDFKRPGTWATASDGIEPGANGSYVGSAYMNVNDDSIKIPANVTYQNITLLQGAAGSAINVGSYGFARGVTDATVDGVYVHRIASGADDDAHAALIATRTCGIKPSGGPNLTLTGVKIKNVYVNSLGNDKDGHGANEVWRVFAIGVQNGSSDRGGFCKNPQWPAASVTIGDWTMTNINVYVNPLRRSQMYDELPGLQNKWGMFRFCTPDGSGAACAQPIAAQRNPASAVAVLPNGSGPAGYYVCGVGGADVSNCWNITDQGQSMPASKSGISAATNVEYNPPDTWGGKLVFPYG